MRQTRSRTCSAARMKTRSQIELNNARITQTSNKQEPATEKQLPSSYSHSGSLSEGIKKSSQPDSRNPKARSHQCPFCVKCFSRKDTLQEHERTHTGERPYRCCICSMRFPTQSIRKRHERRHAGDKLYFCDHCGLSFSGRPSLMYHLKVHIGVRPFKCQLCNKRFIEKSHLNRHAVVHTGEKRFVCSHCGDKFKRNISLQNHIRKHNGIALVTCQHCGQKFYAKDSFEYHLQVHAGIRPFCCSICGFAFLKNTHLQRHLLRVHKNRNAELCQKGGQRCSKTSSQNVPKVSSSPLGKITNFLGVGSLHRRPYACTYCPNQFTHKKELENHLKFHTVTWKVCATKNENTDEGSSSDEVWLPTQLLCEVVLDKSDSSPETNVEIKNTAPPKRRKVRKKRRRQ